jgi:FkbM family methyltransferase
VKIDFSYQGKNYSLAAADGDYIVDRVKSDGTFYEIDLLEDVRAVSMLDEPLIIDVGANIGNHTLFFAGVMAGRVIAVEPEAGNLKSLRDNIAANGLGDRVKVLACGLGSAAGTAGLVQRIAGNAGTFAVDHGQSEGDLIEIRPLDSIVDEGDKVSLIKIDVEGYELEVLKGAVRTLKAHRPVVTVESHSAEHFAGLAAFLSPLGYLAVDIAGRSDNFTWVHEKTIGSQQLKNIRQGLDLRRLRRQFRQVYLATDRISNLVRNEGKTGLAWREKAGTDLAALAASAKSADERLAQLDRSFDGNRTQILDGMTALRGLTEQGARSAESVRTELSVYWKSLIDMVGQIRGQFQESDGRLLAFRQELLSIQTQLPKDIEHLRVAILRGISRQLDDRGRLEETINGVVQRVDGQVRQALDDSGTRLGHVLGERFGQLEQTLKSLGDVQAESGRRSEDLVPLVRQVGDESREQFRQTADRLAEIDGMVAAGEARSREALEGLTHRLAEIGGLLEAGDARSREEMEGLSHRLAEVVGSETGELLKRIQERTDVLGRAIRLSETEVKKALEHRKHGHARRELELNDLVAKLLDCQEQLRGMTEELLQAKSDRQRLVDDGAVAKREVLARDLAIREWEGAYQLLHGSRALRASRKIRAAIGRRQPAHDVPARRVDIAAAVGDYLRQASLDEPSLPLAGLHEVRKTGAGGGRDRVRAGVATMPGREDGLAIVLDSICPQVDEVFVYLNGFDQPPACVLAHDNVRAFIGPDVGDRGKFRFIDGFEGYFISIDDDIAYPRFYVQTLIDGIERYGRKAAVGWHGSVLLDGFVDYYDPKSRRVLSFGSERGADTQVHVLGTGCTAFHTDTIRISYCDFLKPNMADIFFALEGQRQSVPFVVLSHRKGWAKPIEFKSSPSISGESMKSSGSKIDVRSITNALVTTQGEWRMPPLPATIARESFTLALIGRTDKERWKKGGILKSSLLTKEMLDPYGVTTHLVDIEKGDVEGLGGAKPQVVMIYPGDPDRPDYAKVEYLVDFHASRGRVVLVNLSLNSVAARSEFVCRRVREWRNLHGDKVWLMTFTDRAHDLAALAPIADALFAVPKTVEIPGLKVRSFGATEGIFLGDYGKLCDDALLGFPVQESLDALRAAVPEAPLFAVKQYRPKVEKNLGIRILPYLSDDYAATLRSARLMVNLVKYATFEMVPAELAGIGVPVVHPRMSFSLSDYLGLASFEVDSVQTMAESAALLYRDPMVWGAASRACESRGAGADFRLLSGQMYARLLRLSRLAVRA